jgi:hypothetical protein
MIKEFLIQWIPWIFNRTVDILTSGKRIAIAAYTEATVKKEWIFLNSLDIPISSIVFPSISEDNIKWRVTLNPVIFTSNLAIESRHISYLGLSIYLPDGTVCDLTDWINDIKWSGLKEPSAVELFTIWCCEMGKPYFNLISTARFDCITQNGDTVNVNVDIL